MLRAVELAQITDKAEIEFALSDTRLMEEIITCGKSSQFLKTIIRFDGTANHNAELDRVRSPSPRSSMR